MKLMSSLRNAPELDALQLVSYATTSDHRYEQTLLVKSAQVRTIFMQIKNSFSPGGGLGSAR